VGGPHLDLGAPYLDFEMWAFVRSTNRFPDPAEKPYSPLTKALSAKPLRIQICRNNGL